MQREGIDASTPWVRAYRFGFAILTFAAVIVQMQQSPNLSNFFSFFTIQSNLIGAVVLLFAAVMLPKPTVTWDLIRGGATIYLALTGVIFNTLLVEITEQLQTTIPWVNQVLHTVMPIVMIVDFLLIPLAHRITWRQSLQWTIYPSLYLVYSLVRGRIVDWYPYPFLDPRTDGGYPRVLAFSVIVLVGFIACCWLLTWLNGWRRSRLGAGLSVGKDGKIE